MKKQSENEVKTAKLKENLEPGVDTLNIKEIEEKLLNKQEFVPLQIQHFELRNLQKLKEAQESSLRTSTTNQNHLTIKDSSQILLMSSERKEQNLNSTESNKVKKGSVESLTAPRLQQNEVNSSSRSHIYYPSQEREIQFQNMMLSSSQGARFTDGKPAREKRTVALSASQQNLPRDLRKLY